MLTSVARGQRETPAVTADDGSAATPAVGTPGDPLPPEAGPVRHRIPVPGGHLAFALYPQFLVRGTGFDASPLATLRTAAPGDLDAGLRALRAAFADPRLREAVAASNPGFYDLAFAPGRALCTDLPYAELTKHGRRQVRTAHRYLRRLLARTETNAFFGPTLVARWAPELDQPVRLGSPQPERGVVGLSHWLVEELAGRHRRALPPAARAWRRDPLWRLDGHALRNPLRGTRLELSPAALRLWSALDRPATPAELLGRAAVPPTALPAALTELAPALRPAPMPPATLVDTTGWLQRNASDHPLAATVIATVAELNAASWPQTHRLRARLRDEVAAAGLAPIRHSGRHYADRDVVNEDRSSPWTGQVRFGRPAWESATRALAALLPTMLLAALLRQADAREALARATGGERTPLLALAGRELPMVSTRSAQLEAVLSALIPADPALAEVRLTADALAAAVQPLWRLVDVRPGDQLAALPGFDLMLTGGGPGHGRWVLSECHDDSSSALGGITSRVAPDGPGQFTAFGAELGSWLDVRRMATVIGRRRSRHITPELPGLSIELSGISAKPAGDVAPASEVEVSPDGAALLHRGVRYQLYPGDVPSTLFTALSLPCLVPLALAGHRGYVPRVVLDGVVLQRRRWQLPVHGFGRGAAGAQAVAAWWQRHGLPEQVFLRHPQEPKPLLLDVRDPLAVDDLTRMPAATVLCTETLPGPDDTWWRPGTDGLSGAGQQAELRLPVLLRWHRGSLPDPNREQATGGGR